MGKSNLRKPAVAGQFYPSASSELKKQIESFIDKKANKFDVYGCVLPHAGYIYSGPVAGYTVSQINIKDRIILLGPNHTGSGTPFSIMTQGIWQTPLGEINIDDELAEALLGSCEYLQDDTLAHLYEHSLEVELPFLQYFKNNFKIVPIAIASNNLSELKEVGKAIASVINKLNIKDSVMIVASSDMTHYEPQSEAEKKDKQAIEAILKLDEDELFQKIRRFNITMCGYAPVAVMLSAVKLLGAQKGRLSKYQTSGDITGDTDSVVGYAGITIS
ncbi:MAG: AmmeMemoRadiSam system protein B [Candidatus Helarchaeota archaeon]|nr:AmmeMemoRadiSam system protein B [Candidatus Helarchaeota archaeon]